MDPRKVIAAMRETGFANDPWYRLALKRVDALMDAAPGSPDGAELVAWADAVIAYEKANANANALLAALQRLVDVVEGGHYRNPIDLTAELDQARAAIAKASK